MLLNHLMDSTCNIDFYIFKPDIVVLDSVRTVAVFSLRIDVRKFPSAGKSR